MFLPREALGARAHKESAEAIVARQSRGSVRARNIETGTLWEAKGQRNLRAKLWRALGCGKEARRSDVSLTPFKVEGVRSEPAAPVVQPRPRQAGIGQAVRPHEL
jgi:hypothetical protein